jgi:hypothetical protein
MKTVLITSSEALETASTFPLCLVETDEGFHAANSSESLLANFVYRLSFTSIEPDNSIRGLSYLLRDVTGLMSELSGTEIFRMTDRELNTLLLS